MTTFKALKKCQAVLARLQARRGRRDAPAIVVLAIVAALCAATPALAESIGLQGLEISAVNQNGSPDVQAGSHPYALTVGFTLSKPEEVGEVGHREFVPAGGGIKDARLELPPGFVGDPNATPKCGYAAFSIGECPDDTAVGEAATTFTGGEDEMLFNTAAVYNMEAPSGVAAEFGYMVKGVQPILLDVSVRTGGDYGLTVNVRNIPSVLAVYASTVTTWGVPAEASHNDVRGKCLGEDESGKHPGESLGDCPVDVPVAPLLTNPTSCGVPRSSTFSVDGWGEPGNFASDTASLPELSGCEKLDFSPTIGVSPDGTQGSTPTGLNVEVDVPQESVLNPVGLAEADVRDTTVTLPAGVQLSPSAADGLQACSLAQIGLQDAEKPSCPDASKVATVHIKTPLLEGELEGAVYLAAPQNFTGLPENPFSSLVALYLVAEEPVRGVLVKLAGKVEPNETTGQLTTTFEDTPQLPFTVLKLEFYGTARAPLATPALCGTYTTETSFVPWSVAEPANPPEVKHPSSSFAVSSGPGGTPCSDPLPFSPSLASGTTNNNAGSFSDLTTTLGREDGQQNIQSVQLHYPPGVSGLLSGVKLCGEAEANAGTCGPESLIGETIVSVGLGNDPFTVTGGKVFITGPYEGAPFGLSIVNPAKAGPFDLQEGRPVVVRAKIEVNPTTAALTVTTNGSGPYAIPHIIEGIPLQIKHVNVNITRPNFTFNPTSCNPAHLTGTINSAEGASSPVSIPFQVTNCGDLKFTPKFAVSTSGKTSKANGASLTAKVSEPSEPQGSQANLTKVKVELPKQLPSRLTTLQKACTNAQFQANPAGCPPESDIGHAKVITPLVPVPLEGPAIFVSHGGEAFPSLTMVLQGYGVTIDLVGTTFISKAGITSTTFKTVPDQPFSSFELTLPEGKFSALAANGNLCKPTTTKTVKKKVTIKVHGHKKTVTRKVKETVASSLVMPNEFVGQNGVVIHQDATIAVTGCPKSKQASTTRKKGKQIQNKKKK